MKERPILFGAPMVRAILDGRKTQTRRIVKPSPHADIKEFLTADPTGFWVFDGHRPVACIHCPHGEAGDRLWVRETWAFHPDYQESTLRAIYRADRGVENDVERWSPSIHMPRWASRILLEIVAVRVERLNDISEADALTEGVTFPHPVKPGRADRMAREAFADLWETINGSGSWAANPWVWVVEFKRVQP